MSTVDLYTDPEEMHLARLVAWVAAEAEALGALLPIAVDAQWTAAPIDRPREDTAERAKNKKADPTGSIATDPDRIVLRNTVAKSELVLKRSVIALRGVRLGLERSLTPWHGGGTER